MKRLLLGSLMSCMLVGQVFCADRVSHIPKDRAFVALSTLVGLGAGLINDAPVTTAVGAFTASTALGYIFNKNDRFFDYMLRGAMTFVGCLAVNRCFRSMGFNASL